MTDPKLTGMFHQLGAIIDISMSVTVYTAAKMLSNEEFDMIMTICENQFINTNNAEPEVYYAELKRFKELFQILKIGM